VAKRKYASIMYVKANLNHEIRRELVKNIRAMFMHKIGTLLVNTVDSVVISTFIGVAVLGKYSNYIAILAAMNSVIVLIFSSLTSVVGHMYVASDKHTMQKYCETFHLINFCVAIVFYTGYYAIVDGLVSVLFSTELVMDRLIVAVISLNGYVQFMRTSVHMFREATGTFYNDRWKPLAEGIVNIVLSIYLVKKYGITGVIIATIITNLLICHVVEPYVLYKNAFSRFPIKHYLRNYAMIFVYLLAQSLMDSVRYEHDNPLVELLVNGFISVGISLTTCGVVLMMSKELRKYMSVVVKKFSKSGKRGSNSI
jgi:O-antigen/teichoic acid export membrane protein